MITQERINNWKFHDSIRGQFGFELYKAMAKDPNIFVLIGDLGYGLFDNHRADMGERVINCGASEQAMLGVGVGLALEGRLVLAYTITSFFLRAAETIGLYLHGEQIPVKLIGSGRNDDYKHDGPSHHAGIAQAYLKALAIKNYYPDTKEEISDTLNDLLNNGKPSFVSLKR